MILSWKYRYEGCFWSNKWLNFIQQYTINYAARFAYKINPYCRSSTHSDSNNYFYNNKKGKINKTRAVKSVLLVVLSIIWMLFIMFLLEHIQEKYNIPIYNEIFDEEYDNSTLGFIILFLPHIIYLLRYIRTKRDS